MVELDTRPNDYYAPIVFVACLFSQISITILVIFSKTSAGMSDGNPSTYRATALDRERVASAACHSWICKAIRPSCALQNFWGERSQSGLVIAEPVSRRWLELTDSDALSFFFTKLVFFSGKQEQIKGLCRRVQISPSLYPPLYLKNLRDLVVSAFEYGVVKPLSFFIYWIY